MKEINYHTVPDEFKDICHCEFNGIQIYCRSNSYESLDTNFGQSWWFPVAKGGKNMADSYKLHWADPNSKERKLGWYMKQGKENLDGLKMYDANGDLEISMDEIIAWLNSVPNRFNMNWFLYQAEEDPCRLENGRIDINHSLWWWKLLDEAFDHAWRPNLKANFINKYIPAVYESDKEKCRDALNVTMSI